MAEHYTRNTESVSAWCNKCQKFTEHRVDSGRKGPCMEHSAPVKPKKRDNPESGDLFERENR